MHNRSRFLPLCAMSALAAAAGPSWAQRAGDVVLGAGVLVYAPQDKSAPLRFIEPVARDIPGSGSKLHTATTLGLNVHYFLSDHWAIEGVFGVPPRLKLSGAGSLEGLGKLGSARLYGPSVLGKYFFGEPRDKFRVSAGVGISYAHFSSARLTNNLQNTLGGALGIAPGMSSTSVKIDNRFGPVFNLGANYAFTPNLGLTLSVSYIPMKTKATLTTSAGGREVAKSEARLRLNPVIPFVYMTYTF